MGAREASGSQAAARVRGAVHASDGSLTSADWRTVEENLGDFADGTDGDLGWYASETLQPAVCDAPPMPPATGTT